MREILFRGKSIDSGAWVYGDLLRYAETAQIWYETDDGKWNCLVDPATVGQYTGFQDRRGKKIFDGDLINYAYEPGNGFWNAVQDYLIEWREFGFYMQGIIGTNKYACLCGYLCSIPWAPDLVEVIGNRWDNPELLEEVAHD